MTVLRFAGSISNGWHGTDACQNGGSIYKNADKGSYRPSSNIHFPESESTCMRERPGVSDSDVMPAKTSTSQTRFSPADSHYIGRENPKFIIFCINALLTETRLAK